MGCVYKIVAKLLGNRLRKVIGKVVGEHQFAFISSRQLLDSVLIANELVDSMSKNNKGGLLLKVDFEKAYDSIC